MSADIDPSLCAAEPPQDDLHDGFSPPPAREPRELQPAAPVPPEPALGDKSPF